MKKTILLITLLLFAVLCGINAENVVTFFTNNANKDNPEYSDTEVAKEAVGNHEFDYGTD